MDELKEILHALTQQPQPEDIVVWLDDGQDATAYGIDSARLEEGVLHIYVKL